MEKIIYTKPRILNDYYTVRSNIGVRITKEEGLATKVEEWNGSMWSDITGSGPGGDDNEAALRLLLSGKKIDLGEVTGTSLEDVLPEAFENYLDNELCTWTLTIPNGTTEIEENAFCEGSGGSGSGGVGLLCTSLTLPDGLTTIGSGAFLNLIEITDLVIPNSVETVGSNAFARCTNLKSVVYPMGAEYGNDVFKDTAIPDMLYSDTAILFVPNDISGDIVIPEGVLTVPSETFRQKPGITSVTFPSTLTNLGEKMFKGCINLKTVIFENSSLESLGQQWFMGSSGSEASDTRTDVILKFDHVIPLSNTMGWNSNVNHYIVPASLLDDYKSATNWSSMTDKFENLSRIKTDTDSMMSVGEESYTVKTESYTGTPELTSVTCDSPYVTNIVLNGNEFTCDVTGGEKHLATFTVAYTIDGVSYTQDIEMEVYVAANALEYIDNVSHAALVDVNSNIYLNTNEWHAANDPTLVGILVSDGTHRYVIGKDYIPSVAYDRGGSSYEYWGGYQIEIDSDHYFDHTLKITDFDGKGNTRRITAVLNETNHDEYFNVEPYSAAGLCNNYTFANGLKGYMWSSGEENIAVQNKDLIKELLTAIGGTTLNAFNTYIWSSTQYSQGGAWFYYFLDSSWGGNGKSSHYCVVPVCAFPFVYSSLLISGKEMKAYYKGGTATVDVESNKSGVSVSNLTSTNENLTITKVSDTQYTVAFADTSYTTADLTVTLSDGTTNTHTIDVLNQVEYNIFYVNHVGLIDINSNLYEDVTSWTNAGSPTLQGILATEDGHSFVMSTDLATADPDGEGSREYLPWGGYQIKVPGIMTTSDIYKIFQDFDGQGNTTKIVSFLNEDTHDSYFSQSPYSVAGVCAEYTFPNGQKGYLWSAGEENIAVKYKSAISTILTDLNKSDWTTNNYVWNSTQYSQSHAWSCGFSSSFWDFNSKNGSNYVVPVCAFHLSSSTL